MTIRPWGQLNWLLPKLKRVRWGLFGTASVEERCLTVHMQGHALPEDERFVCVIDPDPADRAKLRETLQLRREALTATGVSAENIPDVGLLATIDDIYQQCELLLETGVTNLIIDISAMPKRWFFLAVRKYLADPRCDTLVATYTAAKSYGATLAENPDTIRFMPGFPGDTEQHYASVIVGIGFEPLGLTSLLSELSVSRVKLLFPFPPGPPGVARNWHFVKTIDELISQSDINPPDRVHVHMYDCPQVFSAISAMSLNGSERVALAPYGPKTVSLAMCLFSIAAERAGIHPIPIYYAQPKRYALDYSTGIRLSGGRESIHAYCLKFDGRPLYEIT